MISSQGLQKLGFTLVDFELQDDWDGKGVYIKNWYSEKSQPSESDITTAHNARQSELDTLLYARNRKKEYDSLNQLELMTDDAANSTTKHADAIAVIKTKWPKDNSGPIE